MESTLTPPPEEVKRIICFSGSHSKASSLSLSPLGRFGRQHRNEHHERRRQRRLPDRREVGPGRQEGVRGGRRHGGALLRALLKVQV